MRRPSLVSSKPCTAAADCRSCEPNLRLERGEIVETAPHLRHAGRRRARGPARCAPRPAGRAAPSRPWARAATGGGLAPGPGERLPRRASRSPAASCASASSTRAARASSRSPAAARSSARAAALAASARARRRSREPVTDAIEGVSPRLHQPRARAPRGSGAPRRRSARRGSRRSPRAAGPAVHQIDLGLHEQRLREIDPRPLGEERLARPARRTPCASAVSPAASRTRARSSARKPRRTSSGLLVGLRHQLQRAGQVTGHEVHDARGVRRDDDRGVHPTSHPSSRARSQSAAASSSRPSLRFSSPRQSSALTRLPPSGLARSRSAIAPSSSRRAWRMRPVRASRTPRDARTTGAMSGRGRRCVGSSSSASSISPSSTLRVGQHERDPRPQHSDPGVVVLIELVQRALGEPDAGRRPAHVHAGPRPRPEVGRAWIGVAPAAWAATGSGPLRRLARGRPCGAPQRPRSAWRTRNRAPFVPERPYPPAKHLGFDALRHVRVTRAERLRLVRPLPPGRRTGAAASGRGRGPVDAGAVSVVPAPKQVSGTGMSLSARPGDRVGERARPGPRRPAAPGDRRSSRAPRRRRRAGWSMR